MHATALGLCVTFAICSGVGHLTYISLA